MCLILLHHDQLECYIKEKWINIFLFQFGGLYKVTFLVDLGRDPLNFDMRWIA